MMNNATGGPGAKQVGSIPMKIPIFFMSLWHNVIFGTHFVGKLSVPDLFAADN